MMKIINLFFKNKFNSVVFLSMLFFSFNFLTPTLGFDPIFFLPYYKQSFKWLDTEIYYLVYYYTQKYNVKIEEVFSIIQIESGNYCKNNLEAMKKVKSYAGAVGLMQVMAIHSNNKVEVLYDPVTNLELGIKYYKLCLQKAKNKEEALKFYNAGLYYKKPYKNQWYINEICYLSNQNKNLKLDNIYR